jgi:hypothetical protein
LKMVEGFFLAFMTAGKIFATTEKILLKKQLRVRDVGICLSPAFVDFGRQSRRSTRGDWRVPTARAARRDSEQLQRHDARQRPSLENYVLKKEHVQYAILRLLSEMQDSVEPENSHTDFHLRYRNIQ